MSAIFDISGFDNICKYIEASKKSKFTVNRYGTTGYNIPVFECTHHETCGNALQEFKNFAQILNPSIVYKIILFDEMEEMGVMGESAGKKTKKRSGKFEVLFILDAHQGYREVKTSNNQQSQISGFNPDQFRESIVAEITKKNEENEVIKALNSFSDRIKALEISQIEDEEDEDDEDELSGNNMSQMLQGVTMLANMLKGGNTQPPVINGTDHGEIVNEIDEKTEKVQKINSAIKRLYAHDKNLHDTLLKLAEIAETKPDTFKFLLSNLGNL